MPPPENQEESGLGAPLRRDLGSARKVFAKKGFAGATMDEIAAASGLAKGTLYLYFKSKRTCT